jgi:hypothetical protein
MKQERERFFISELPYFLAGASGHLLLGGFQLHTRKYGLN